MNKIINELNNIIKRQRLDEYGVTLTTRSYNKEKYTFYLSRFYSKFDKLYYYKIIVETPSNSLGYTDIVMLDSRGKAYTMNRHLPKYILKGLEKQIKMYYRQLENLLQDNERIYNF